MNEQTQNFSAGAKELVNNASRLGLTWDLRPATVNSIDPLKVIVDGDPDSTVVSAQTMVGALAPGNRVYAILVPPSGVFVAGFLDQNFTAQLQSPVNLDQAGTVGSTTSATYVNAPGLPFVTVNKQFDSSITNILAMLTIGLFSSATSTAASFALNLTGGTGTDVEMTQAFINTANAHLYIASNKLLTGLGVGTYTLSLRWRRVSGAGTLQMDTSDWVSITAQEVWAQ